MDESTLIVGAAIALGIGLTATAGAVSKPLSDITGVIPWAQEKVDSISNSPVPSWLLPFNLIIPYGVVLS